MALGEHVTTAGPSGRPQRPLARHGARRVFARSGWTSASRRQLDCLRAQRNTSATSSTTRREPSSWPPSPPGAGSPTAARTRASDWFRSRLVASRAPRRSRRACVADSSSGRRSPLARRSSAGKCAPPCAASRPITVVSPPARGGRGDDGERSPSTGASAASARGRRGRAAVECVNEDHRAAARSDRWAGLDRALERLALESSRRHVARPRAPARPPSTPRPPRGAPR